MMKFNKFISILVIFFGLIQCNSEINSKSFAKNTIIVEKFKVRNNKKLKEDGWTKYKLENIDICIPSEWKVVNQSKIDFFCYLNNSDENTYFALGKFNTDFNIYLKDTYSQLINDSLEIAEGYTVKKLIYSDKVLYYCEYYTKYEYKQYIMYSMLFNKFNSLYDISLKVEKDSSFYCYNIFQHILFNLSMEDKQVFRERDRIKEIEIIDLSKL